MSHRFPRRTSGFTLTELLIVITIIAVLASLIAAAAINALRRGRTTRVLLEMSQMTTSLEDVKAKWGVYPPNASAHPVTNGLATDDVVRAFKKAFPKHREPPELIAALAGGPVTGAVKASDLVSKVNGMSIGLDASEALYFWQGGFSSDPQYPLSGEGGPAFVAGPNNEVLENRRPDFPFDLARLGPRDGNNQFSGRSIRYNSPRVAKTELQINFWAYRPASSQQPYLYFDTSRHDPVDYDPVATNSTSGTTICALKKLREGFNASASTPLNKDIEFLGGKKFQVLHCGLDDRWGDYTAMCMPNVNRTANANVSVFPDGPFIGDIADDVSNVTNDTISGAAAQ